MNEDAPRKRLGRGLAALIGEIDPPANESQAPKAAPSADGRIAIDRIVPNSRNPRRHFNEDEIEDLAQSIRVHGLVQPVVVRRQAGNPEGFELIAGERRWRASRKAGLTEVPYLLRDVDDRTALELAIIENVQRADLDPIEEGHGYQALIDEYEYSQNELAGVIGKSRSHVANTLRLLRLPQEVQAMLSDGRLSAGHARTLITAEEPEALAQRIVEQGLTVRQAEALAQGGPKNDSGHEKSRAERDEAVVALEERLAASLGLKTRISPSKKGGEVRLKYRNQDELDQLLSRLFNS
ncbi:ParB/RepB/Spo0J family partition protein [Notoacmeibacter sp. MSK16QG-6]|uniref:ParB/RepB/Spo0J family partition protein n=1 Tax=Notoacmeibacter sp. MSK16QG-6 TaxID=2957982 RepID=UPI00209F1C12|nr:ParB/RepB/Spo0J family partition protein [Notoacmeibacter sp. MSK16QG-6]MCP1199113.1 ParB/RepB/Spo0J family partition protein [Notoacmeibacter sp. MSK16QG-6]